MIVASHAHAFLAGVVDLSWQSTPVEKCDSPVVSFSPGAHQCWPAIYPRTQLAAIPSFPLLTEDITRWLNISIGEIAGADEGSTGLNCHWMELNNYTALHLAAASGNAGIIDKLVASGADIDAECLQRVHPMPTSFGIKIPLFSTPEPMIFKCTALRLARYGNHSPVTLPNARRVLQRFDFFHRFVFHPLQGGKLRALLLHELCQVGRQAGGLRRRRQGLSLPPQHGVEIPRLDNFPFLCHAITEEVAHISPLPPKLVLEDADY